MEYPTVRADRWRPPRACRGGAATDTPAAARAEVEACGGAHDDQHRRGAGGGAARRYCCGMLSPVAYEVFIALGAPSGPNPSEQ